MTENRVWGFFFLLLFKKKKKKAICQYIWNHQSSQMRKASCKNNWPLFATGAQIRMLFLNEVSVFTERDITSLKKTIQTLPKTVLSTQVKYFTPCSKWKQALHKPPHANSAAPTHPPFPQSLCAT